MADDRGELERVAQEAAADVERRCLDLLTKDEEAQVQVRVNRRSRKPLSVRVFVVKRR